MKRRSFLVGVPISGTVSAAGCLSTDSDEEPEPTDDEDDEGGDGDAAGPDEDGEEADEGADDERDRDDGNSDPADEDEDNGSAPADDDHEDEETDDEESVSEGDDEEGREGEKEGEEIEEYESIVIFRNDDIQADHEPELMRTVNDVFIDEEVPVTLGIIPDMRGEAPLSNDPDLCSYLRSLEEEHPEQFEMALHGYEHESQTEFAGASEFGGLSEEEQRERLANGEKLLADCVDSPSSTFVPPLNTYDETTVEVLDDAGYTVVSGGSWFTNQQYGTDETYFEDGGLLHLPGSQAFENWTEIDDPEEEVVFYDLDTLTESFDDAHDENEVHVVMLHYQYFTNYERLEQLKALIQYMKAEDGVGFMTIEQFATGLETGAVERADDGWRVRDPTLEET